MGWIYREADQHKCPKPGYDSKVAVGDIWQCDSCKKKYKVTNFKRGSYDQRDGWYNSSISWQEITYDPGVTSWRGQ